jgi:hypothetical protein
LVKPSAETSAPVNPKDVKNQQETTDKTSKGQPLAEQFHKAGQIGDYVIIQSATQSFVVPLNRCFQTNGRLSACYVSDDAQLVQLAGVPGYTVTQPRQERTLDQFNTELAASSPFSKGASNEKTQ